MPGNNNEKTLDAVVAKQGREEGNRNIQQEGGVSMTSLPRIPAHSETAIKVAGLTVAPNQLIGGGEPDENVVTIITREETLSFTPAEACALSAALSAVAVHLMESEPREIRRNTEPGQPEQNGIGGGL